MYFSTQEEQRYPQGYVDYHASQQHDPAQTQYYAQAIHNSMLKLRHNTMLGLQNYNNNTLLNNPVLKSIFKVKHKTIMHDSLLKI